MHIEPRLLVAATSVAIAAALFSPTARTQNCFPLIGLPGKVSGIGNDQYLQVAETDVAASDSSVMVVAINVASANPQRIIWGHKALTASTFTEGLIPNPFGVEAAADPSVAYDRANGNYLCAALLTDNTGGGFATYSIAVSTFTGGAWGTWNVLASAVGIGFPALDKPFIVAGTPGEFYVTWWTALTGGGAYGWARTTDGGLSWVTGTTAATGFFALQPSVTDDSGLFCAYNAGLVAGGVKYRFLLGVDAPGGGINFLQIKDPANNPVEVVFDHLSIANAVPGTFSLKGTAQIAVDPTNDRDFYVCHHARKNGTANVNVYVSKVVFGGGGWTAGPLKRVNPGPGSCDEVDEFQPHIAVDAEGRVHVVYYDDHNFCQSQSDATPFPKFDVRYSRSCDGGATWQHTLLTPPSPNAAWFDTSLLAPTHPGGPLEYNGITFVDLVPGGALVWSAFLGTDQNDPGFKDVIWAVPYRL